MAPGPRPEAEVIVGFADGFSYSKKRLQEAFESGVFDVSAVKTPKPNVDAKMAENVDLIVHELEIPRQVAIKTLVECKGDLNEAFKVLITPSSS